MTAREVYEYLLIELNKVQAPAMLLGDFNYFANKVVNSIYTAKRYNIFEVNQQTSDDLNVLKGTAVLSALVAKPGAGATFIGTLPKDYFHLLNCILEFKATKDGGCYKAGDTIQKPAGRLTAQMYSGIINNYYLKPSLKKPYFYVHQDAQPQILASDSEANQPAGSTISNASEVKLELRYGKLDPILALDKVYVDYLRSPRLIRLTEAQLDADLDTSQTIEFPDYVIYEIIKELVVLLMENSSDPRLNTNLPINQAIPNGGGGQQQGRR